MSRARATFAGLVVDEREQIAQLTVPEAEAQDAEGLAHEHGWLDPDDGDNWPLMFVAFGLAALRRDGRGALDAASAHAERAATAGRGSRLSALRFAAFELARTNRLLEIKQNALRIDNRGMRLRLGEEAP